MAEPSPIDVARQEAGRREHGARLLELRHWIILEELSFAYEAMRFAGGRAAVCADFCRLLELTYLEWPTGGAIARELAALGMRQAADESERKAAAGSEGGADG